MKNLITASTLALLMGSVAQMSFAATGNGANTGAGIVGTRDGFAAQSTGSGGTGTTGSGGTSGAGGHDGEGDGDGQQPVHADAR